MIEGNILMETPMGFFTLDKAECDMLDALRDSGDRQSLAEYMLSLARERNRRAVRVWRVLLGMEAR